jgi:hypothetical protein
MTIGTDSTIRSKTRHADIKHKTEAVSGPFRVNPKILTHKEDTSRFHYHNEQDNFSRPDSLPYRPAPLKSNDTSSHSYNDSHEDISGTLRNSSPAVNFQFDAESCQQVDPPDNSIAISNAGIIVSAVNCGIVVYNSSGQQVGNTIDYVSFFNVATGFVA